MKKRFSLTAIAAISVALSIIMIFLLGYFMVSFLPDKSNITITSDDATKEYDGTPLTNSKWDITSGKLKKGDRLSVYVFGSQTNIGSSNNHFSVKVINSSGKDVTDEYVIKCVYGILTVTEPPKQPDPSEPGNGSGGSEGNGGGGGSPIKDSRLKIYAPRNGTYYLRQKSYGNYIENEWDGLVPSYAGDESKNPLLFLSAALQNAGYQKEELKAVTEMGEYYSPYHLSDVSLCDNDDRSIPYGGKEYTAHYYYNYDVSYLRKLSLKGTAYEQEELAYRKFVRQNYLSTTSNEKAVLLQLANEAGISANDENVIEKVISFIRNAATYNLGFKRYPDNVNHVTYFLLTAKEGVCEQYASAATLMFRALGIPARYVTGYMVEARANQWTEIDTSIGHAWVEVYVDGIGWIPVEVTGGTTDSYVGDVGIIKAEPNQKMTFKPVYTGKEYDGSSLSATQKITGFEKWEKAGFTYSVTVSGTRTDYGKETTEIQKIVLRDPEGRDVTEQFPFSTSSGILQVYYSTLFSSSQSVTKTYDDTPISSSTVTSGGSLMPGHTAQVIMTASNGVGTRRNTYELKIFDENKNNVTDYYQINRNYGILTISAVEMSVKADDASKVYDGTPLTCNGFTITAGNLLSGHRIRTYTFSGTQTDIGRSDNILTSIEIVNSEGKNVTANYAIELLPGKLRVTAR